MLRPAVDGFEVDRPIAARRRLVPKLAADVTRVRVPVRVTTELVVQIHDLDSTRGSQSRLGGRKGKEGKGGKKGKERKRDPRYCFPVSTPARRCSLGRGRMTGHVTSFQSSTALRSIIRLKQRNDSNTPRPGSAATVLAPGSTMGQRTAVRRLVDRSQPVLRTALFCSSTLLTIKVFLEPHWPCPTPPRVKQVCLEI